MSTIFDPDCSIKKLHKELEVEAYDQVMQSLEMGISDLIEVPIDKSPLIEEKLKQILKPRERRLLKRELKREKERYNEHSKLYNFLFQSSKDIFDELDILYVPQDFIENRLLLINGFFGMAYNEFVWANKENVYISGLNNSEDWDAGKIRAMRRRFEEAHKVWYERGKGKDKITNYENTIKAPLRMVANIDPTGSAYKLVLMSQQLLDTYLQNAFKWKNGVAESGLKDATQLNLTDINAKISTGSSRARIPNMEYLAPHQVNVVANQFFEELIHTEARNIIPGKIPINPAEFSTWRDTWLGDMFFQLVKFQSERHKMGPSGAEYVLIPMHADKKGMKELRKIRKQNIKDGKLNPINDPGKFEKAYLAYRIPSDWVLFRKAIKRNALMTEESLKEHILENEVEEGFHRAGADEVFNYDLIEGTNKPKRKFTAFTKDIYYPNYKELDDKGDPKDKLGFLYQPPAEWMPDIWEALEDQRNWSELFWDVVIEGELQNATSEMDDYRRQMIRRLTDVGFDPEDIAELDEIVSNMGGPEFNMWPDKQGNLVSANSFATKASRDSWGHIKYGEYVKNQMLRDAIEGIEKKKTEINSSLTNYKNIRNSEDVSPEEKYSANEEIEIGEAKVENLDKAIDAINIKLHGDPSTEEGKAEIMLADRFLATKHRTLIFDKRLRRKTRDVWNDYVDQAYRTMHATHLKIQLYKTMIALRNNPSLVRYVVNEAKNAVGEPFTESGIMGRDYSDEKIADFLPESYGPEDVKAAGLAARGMKTAWNLGFNTGLTNNFQRLTVILNEGLIPMIESIRAIRYGDEDFPGKKGADSLMSQIEETGVLEPGNAITDMLVMGIAGVEGNWKEMYLPMKDYAALWKNTKLVEWLEHSEGWDEMLTTAAGRSPGEAETVAELIRIKTLLHNWMHGKAEKKYLRKQLRDAKIGLRQSYINRLVNWRIAWAPVGWMESITLKGGERDMRAEVWEESTHLKETGNIQTLQMLLLWQD